MADTWYRILMIVGIVVVILYTPFRFIFLFKYTAKYIGTEWKDETKTVKRFWNILGIAVMIILLLIAWAMDYLHKVHGAN